MPLVAHSKLPTFGHLQEQGHEMLSLDKAVHQDIRELHVGFLNMMPDAALQATERQFIRLVGGSNPIAQFYVYPFSLPGLARGDETLAYIDEFYFDFEELKRDGLDALIITGANVVSPDLAEEPFWDPLVEVVEWAGTHVTSVLCSCLATHAVLKHLHGIERVRLPEKKWGVFSHRICEPEHPLLRDINTRFDVPHSRHNDISREQLENAGLRVLVESEEGGVHIASSRDGFRLIYFQGHPEYDIISLLKEYKREVKRFLAGELDAPPPFPDHYFPPPAQKIASEYVEQAVAARDAGEPIPRMPEDEMYRYLDNTWGDTAKAIVNNWLGLIYKFTDLDRKTPFMDGVDPNDPLGLVNG